jgi:hypothetical protein
LTKDTFPVIKGDVGEHKDQGPKCAWASFSVNGM